MGCSVNFDDEPRIQAYEIDDVPVDGMLAPELPMRQLPVSEGLPQQVPHASDDDEAAALFD